MPNWNTSMQQTFEYYTVDPSTWGDVKQLTCVKRCTIDWDLETDTLGSATIDLDEQIKETYIRIYLITIQNGVKEKFPLGTFLVQSLPISFDGMKETISADAYTPLIELNEKYPDIGYFLEENENIMYWSYMLTKANLRAPVVKPSSTKKLNDDLVAETNETWLSYIRTLMSNAEYSYSLDEMGRVLFSPIQKIEALQPVWTFNDDNSSILYPDIDMDRDLYGIPNVIEVIASNGSEVFHITVENNNIDSPTSIPNRGRRIVHRETDPKITGYLTEDRVKEYAQIMLKELSSMEHTLTFTHGYCPVHVGDCIRLNYEKFNLHNVKAKIISQSIKCEPGCPVTSKAVFTTKLWR